jgi:hypothetical protein
VRVAFLQKDPLPDPYVGVIAASAVFRGHQARAFLPGAERDLIGAVREFAPGALVFHVAGGFEAWAAETGRKLSRALGGPPVCFIGDFPSDHPELALRAGIDYVLCGDPDETIPELLWRIGLEKTLEGTMGTAHAGPDGALRMAPPRGPIGDLDETAAADLEIYRRYPFVLRQTTAPILVGRGTVENLHAGVRPGLAELRRRFRPARRHSVQGALSRVQMMKQRRPGYRRFGFRDDTFVTDPDWLAEFLDRYRVEVELPFGCMARPDHLTADTVARLADAGCDCVRLGIESGDPALRASVAGAPIPDEQVVEAATRLRERGIRVHTTSFLGLPGETEDSARRTVELVAKLRPDHAFCMTVWDDPEATTTPFLTRLAWLVPYVARAPLLAGAILSASRRPADPLFERLFQIQHDVGFVRSGELGPLSIAHIAASMSRTRARP